MTAIKHHDQGETEEERLCFVYTSQSKKVSAETQGRRMEAGTEAEVT